jgi:two-component system, NtrC family, response regulator HydG
MRAEPAVSLLGRSPEMDRVRLAIERLAACDFTVLITGESGTGKEIVARMIHTRSRRSAGPFIAVSGAALVDSLLEAELFGIEDRTATGVRGRPGKLELAEGGTFFLDEVAELSRHAQAALLRVLQDFTLERVGGHRSRRIDTRIIVATNQSIPELVARKRFRADLFYRLSGVEIALPPLRDRRDDVRELAEHFFSLHGGTGCLQAGVLAALRDYDWPGNVRELERVIQRAIAWSDGAAIQREVLPDHIDVRKYCGCPTPSADESLRATAARYVRAVLERCGGNKTLACRRLDIAFHTLQKYLAPPRKLRKRHTSQSPGFRSGSGGLSQSRSSEALPCTQASSRHK